MNIILGAIGTGGWLPVKNRQISSCEKENNPVEQAVFCENGSGIVHNNGNAGSAHLGYKAKFTWNRAGKYMARKSVSI